MAAEFTSTVTLTVHLPGGDVTGEVGTITVPRTGTGVSEADVREALGTLLQHAGCYLRAGGTILPRVVGES